MEAIFSMRSLSVIILVYLLYVPIFALSGCMPEKRVMQQSTVEHDYRFEYRSRYGTSSLFRSLFSDIGETRLSFWPLPGREFSYQSYFLPIKVKPRKTPWAEPWNRSQIVINMNRILKENGFDNKAMRVRMIAHAVVASGWRQNVWNYNVWGVRKGSFDGSWYEMPTYEADENGEFYKVEDAEWRSFSSFSEAIVDFTDRINPSSQRPAYRKAYRALSNRRIHPKIDAEYWDNLKDGNYYTAVHFSGKKFAMLCNTVRLLLKGSYENPS
jgi:hypothetical protein